MSMAPAAQLFTPARVCVRALQVAGAAALADAQLPVEQAALFSSTSALWSQPGAAAYSAANRCLDGLASAWQAAGRPATAVNFGPFGGVGMAAAHRWVG